MREERNLSRLRPPKPREDASYGFFVIFVEESFFTVESVFVVVVVVVDIALSCLVVSIMAGAGLMAGAATTAVSAGAASFALHAAKLSFWRAVWGRLFVRARALLLCQERAAVNLPTQDTLSSLAPPCR